MDISKIDKNFAIGQIYDDGEMRYYNIPCEPFDLYGVYYEKDTDRFVRMPSAVADKVSKGVSGLNAHTTGGRIRFSTDSRKISIAVTYDWLDEMSNMPLIGSSSFVLVAEIENGFEHVSTFYPRNSVYDETAKKGYSATGYLYGEMKNYILFFPLYNDVKSLKIGLDKDAVVTHGTKYREDIKPILYYGSSITQGGCASRPDNDYQAIISKRNNIDFINLGFSGNAKAEPAICEYLSTVDCSVFVCDYDHNAPDAEFLSKTHYPFYRMYREKRPNTPIIFVSKPNTEHDNELNVRFNIIKETYEKALAAGDKNVYLIDGRTFFAGRERDACTVDGCHPNDVGFFKMADVIGAKIEEILHKNRI